MKNKQNIKWILLITSLTFVISIIFSYLSETILKKSNIVIELLVLLTVILIGIIFDMIGVAVTTCAEHPFHAMASRKIKGAKTAIKLIKNKDKVSSFCNDVIGDICGIISGSAGVALSTILANSFHLNLLMTSLLITATIAALTIGGKALGKTAAINKSTKILFEFSKFLFSTSWFINTHYLSIVSI